MTDTTDLELPTNEPVHRWFPLFLRAIKACRFYPAASAARARPIEVAFAELRALLSTQPEVRFDVLNGRLSAAGERVHTDPEKDGLARVLLAASIFELTLTAGITGEELASLSNVLAIDFARRDNPGEDLVTALWRLELPHVRYRYFDVFQVAVRPEDVRSDYLTDTPDDEEMERLRRETARIVATLASAPGLDRDVVTMEDGRLETPEAARDASGGEAFFDAAVELYTRRVPPEARREHAVPHGGHDALAAHLTAILVEALRQEDRPDAPSPAREVLIRLHDGMIEAGRWEDATRLVERLQVIARGASTRAELTFAERLLARFADEAHVARAAGALNGAAKSGTVLKIVAHLRALDHHAAPALLALAAQGDPAASEAADPPLPDRMRLPRQAERAASGPIEAGGPLLPGRTHLFAVVLLDVTTRDRSALAARLPSLGWELARAVLERALALGEADRLELALGALAHPHPRVRSDALRHLPAGQGALIARAIHDRHPLVRVTALKIAAQRRSGEALREILPVLRSDELDQHDPRELRQLLVTYASIAGEPAIPELARLLGRSGGLLQRRRTAAVREAAAAALEVIGSDAARALLEQGARSLNLGIRSACRAVLEREPRPPEPAPAPEPPPPARGVRLHALPAEPLPRLPSGALVPIDEGRDS